MRVLIAGGGLGGLILALMLQRTGIEGLVLEAAPDVRPLGVGINALPHSIRELERLDLLDALDSIAVRTRTLTYMTERGQVIWSEPRGLHAGHEVPQFSVHRGRLQAMLWHAAAERLGAAAIRADARVIAARETTAGVAVDIETALGARETVVGDALVGADGIHSTIRAALLGEDPAIRWNGIQMWRGALDWPAFGSGDEMIIAGDAVAKLVLYPIAQGAVAGTRLTNWVVYARIADGSAPPPARESWSRLGSFEDFAPLVARFRLPFIDIEALARATPQIFVYPMCDRDPLRFWTRGRVTLLGDAAHSMYPVGSNGASQAILDARCLTDLLREHPVTEALRLYEMERLPATAAIVRSNRIGGPERVIDLVAERAPNGFTRIEDVASTEELAAIVRGYATLAGFAAPPQAPPA
jgi:5-methylphenazine-1-carboxylate 1-monooxygenase